VPYPPHNSWFVQRQLDDGTWAPYAPTDHRIQALERIKASRMQYPKFKHRLMKVTTSYTIDNEEA
jgi:energy-converting hydrogenase Eha subunit F